MATYDFLKPVLGDDLFAQVEDKLNGSGLNIINLSDGSYIPKSKFDDERNKIKALNTNIADLTRQLNDAQEKANKADTMQATIDNLNKTIADKDASIANTAKQYRIKDALREMKAKNVDIVMSQLKMDKIGEKDGQLTGLTEQVDALRKSYAYLFDTNAGSNRGGFGGSQDIGGNGNTNADVNNAIRALSGRA